MNEGRPIELQTLVPGDAHEEYQTIEFNRMVMASTMIEKLEKELKDNNLSNEDRQTKEAELARYKNELQELREKILNTAE